MQDIVVPAKAGTHNHGAQLLNRLGPPSFVQYEHPWLWVPARGRDDVEMHAPIRKP
jgi:hypothetical protein